VAVQQLVPEPQALFDANGKMRTGQKSTFLKAYLKEHEMAGYLIHRLPERPQAYVLEGVFMITADPPPDAKTLKVYFRAIAGEECSCTTDSK
jgi:hypothetical protein